MERSSLDLASKRQLVEKDSEVISIKRQCELLGIPRSSYYAKPKQGKSPEGFTDEEERAMRIMDEAHRRGRSTGRARTCTTSSVTGSSSDATTSAGS